MKHFFIPLFFLMNYSNSPAQNIEKISEWLNTNAISIANTNSNDELNFPKDKIPVNFFDVKLFAVGEASHQHKDFFKVKVNLFKYLVKNFGVKLFILEESYGAANEINEYLLGKELDPKKLVNNFRQSIWKTNEFLELLIWIKSYNEKQKEYADKIKFYGIDTMFNYKLVHLLNTIFQENNYQLDPSSKEFLYLFDTEQLLPDNDKKNLNEKLKTLEDIRKSIEFNVSFKKNKELSLHILNVLKQYITFLANPNEKDRDQAMANNVQWVMDYEGTNSKAFIWAHNDHIKKTVLNKTSNPTMGNLLSQKFSKKMYSIGLEFAIGEIRGMTKEGKWELGNIEKPIKNTLAEVLINTKFDNYFFDITLACQDSNMEKFVKKNYNYLMIGGYGLRLKNIKYSLLTGNLYEMYDGILFIKKVTLNEPLQI